MEVVVTTGAIYRANLQSNRHQQQTNTQFFTCRMPFVSPNQQCQGSEGKMSHCMDLLTPSSPGVFQLCVWPLLAPGYLGEGCHASHWPSDARTPLATQVLVLVSQVLVNITGKLFTDKLATAYINYAGQGACKTTSHQQQQSTKVLLWQSFVRPN